MPLIVHADDELTERWDLKYMINELDPSVEVAGFSNGLELAQYLSSVTNDDLPSLIFLDLSMPIWDGIKTLNALKSEPRFMAIPVYMWSVAPSKKEVDLCLQLGAERFISRPTNEAERLKARIMLASLITGIATKNDSHQANNGH